MKAKTFLNHFVVIGSGTLISMVIGLITTPIITRLVSTEVYGQYAIFQMYANIALMVLCLGLDQSLMRFYYDFNDIDYQRKLLKKCTILPIIITFIIGIILILSFITLGNTDQITINKIILLIVCVIFQIINRMSLITLRLEFESKKYSMINILHKIIFVGSVLILYYIFNQKDFYNMAISMTMSYIIASITGILIQRKLWHKNINKISINYRKLLSYGMPYILAMGITTLFQAIDKISLNYYYDYSQVGIYSSAMTLVNIFAIIQTTFNSLWTPTAIKHFKEDKEDKIFYSNANKIITVVMFFIGITLILFKNIFILLLGSAYREAVYILPCLIFNPIMYTISETTVCGIVFKEKSKMQVIIAMGACITNIIGNIILVPNLGGRGAAISTGIAYIVFFTMRTIISKHYFNVHYNLCRFYIVTAIVLMYALYNTFVEFNILTILFYIIILALLLWLYKDTIKQINNVIKNKLMSLNKVIAHKIKKR